VLQEFGVRDIRDGRGKNRGGRRRRGWRRGKGVKDVKEGGVCYSVLKPCKKNEFLIKKNK